ncbi:glycosyltransferase [uncultured Deefgea sp.]|uniref:glycosyltransferase family 2 protein n=1 Tax=uncultured Deefgea sp. TaxID=1304914 RepID=UPI002624B7FA|nr:glycosyltransferase [uncultured Deefgea sp.]
MPAFNAAKYIEAAIDSVLNQTYRNFELIIVDDGSSDATLEIVRRYTDDRVKLHINPENKGLIYTRNYAIANSNGLYIAFLDSDDMALPKRLEKQVDFLETERSVAGVGAFVQSIDSNGTIRGKPWRYPTQAEEIKALLLFKICINTSSFMIRANVLKSNLFNLAIPYAEDYALYIQLSKNNRLVNLPEVLTFYRVHSTNTSKKKKNELSRCLDIITLDELRSLNINASPDELIIHRYLEWFNLPPSVELMQNCCDWLNQIKTVNSNLHIYDQIALDRVLNSIWISVCEQHAPLLGFKIIFKYLNNNPGRFVGLDFTRLVFKVLVHQC